MTSTPQHARSTSCSTALRDALSPRSARRHRRTRRGDAGARSGAWRHGDQRGVGRRQGRAPAAGEACSRHRRTSAAGDRRCARRAPRGPASSTSACDPAAFRALLPDILRAGERVRRQHHRQRHARSTSNTSPPIPPARCISAIAAAPWWATRWPTCSPRPATTSPRNTTSTTPARRSPRSPGRPTGATCRRSARRSTEADFSDEVPGGLQYRGEYLIPVGERSPNNTAHRSRSRTAASPRRKSGSTSCATSPSRR